MGISHDEVEKVSLLARLRLTAEELNQMTTQLGAILQYMELLAEVNTEGVEPLAHPLDITNVFREDTVQPSLDRERALAGAPNRDEACYLVPAVLGPSEA